MINDKIALNNKKKELLELKKYIIDQRQKFRSELFNLKSQLEAWEKQNVLLPPEDGKVIFYILFAGKSSTICWTGIVFCST